MSTPSGLRPATRDDLDALLDLWRRCGLGADRARVEGELEGMLALHPELLLVVERGERLVASVLGSYDGRRGWINRLATDPSFRGQGLGRALVDELERRLAARGCPQVNLLIDRANAGVAGLYRDLGYVEDDVVFMRRRLGATLS